MVYIGKNNKAASVSAIKIGDENGKAANVVGGWVGDENGKARRIWSLDRPMWKFTCQNGVNLHVSGSGLAIDYGDGASENIGTQTSPYHISHIYADTEPHQVTLYGVLSYARFWNDHDEEDAKSYLQTVDSPFHAKNRIVSFSGTFAGCTSLATIPSGLFDNCTAATSFNSTFISCTSLATIPSGLFDNCTAATSFSGTFSNCTVIASSVPELWDTTKWPNVTGHFQCFYNCTNAANYADIPAGWK